jgi:hypothetical protein
MAGPEHSSADDQLIAALEALFLDDERWKPKSATGVTMVQRSWPDGTVDTLILLSPASAYAVREDAQGGRPWSMGPAPAEQIVGHARKLLPPDDPNASKPLRSDRSNPPEAERR